MFNNYFKIAIRSLLKNKVYSLLNVLGLAVGLLCCILISIYISYEASFDSGQKNKDSIYQVGTEFIGLGNNLTLPNTPAGTGAILKNNFPEIEEYARLGTFYGEDKVLLQNNNPNSPPAAFYEKGFLADASFFQIFDYQFTEGNAKTALKNPNTIIISEEVSKRIFQDAPALNKLLRLKSSFNGNYDYVVTGVFRKSIQPSHIESDFFIGMNGGGMEDFIRKQGGNLALNYMFYTYLKLRPGSDPHSLELKFTGLIQKYAADDLKAAGFQTKQFLVPLSKIHLDSRVKNNITQGTSLNYLYILGSTAVFILIIACVNFMNLTTARSSKRAAEVGIRKVLGAQKRSLIYQFLGEAVLLSLLAFVLALGFAWLLFPLFKSVTSPYMSFSFIANSKLIIGFIVIAVVTGLLAGSYPAFYLSSFQPVNVLKGRLSYSFSAITFRKALVVFQFVVSVVLIAGSLIIERQMGYLQSADLGFDKNRQIVVPLHSPAAKSAYEGLRQELVKRADVNDVGASIFYPGIGTVSDNNFFRDGQSMQNVKDLKMNYVDTHFLQTLNIRRLSGRLFSDEYYSADTAARALIINQAAVKALGFSSSEQALNQTLHTAAGNHDSNYKIIGVVKNFHFEDLHVSITPLCFILNTPPQYNYMIIHAKSGNISPLLQSINNTWRELIRSEPFEYSFLEEDFQKNYDAELRLSVVVKGFTAIAIVITCLGLFGLTTLTTQQRVREIGIRKVLGASVAGILILLSRDFLKLMLISVVIAVPLAWILANMWLHSFAYRIAVSWLGLLQMAGTVVISALLTICLKIINAANANPVKSIKSD